MEEKNIFQRMAAITAELQTVAKNLTVETSKGKGYKAVSERDIIDAVKPLECAHGVYSYPMKRETTDAQMLESDTQYGKKTTFYSRIKTVYRFVNVDDPEDYIDTEVFSVGIDSQDKGDGKAMTYGDKYALMKAYKISTGDDPDQTASEDTDYRKAATRAEKPREPIFCEVCGKQITDQKKRNGEVWAAEEIAKYTMRGWGKVMCADCGKAASKDAG